MWAFWFFQALSASITSIYIAVLKNRLENAKEIKLLLGPLLKEFVDFINQEKVEVRDNDNFFSQEEVGEVKKALRDVYGKGEEGARGRALGRKG